MAACGGSDSNSSSGETYDLRDYFVPKQSGTATFSKTIYSSEGNESPQTSSFSGTYTITDSTTGSMDGTPVIATDTKIIVGSVEYKRLVRVGDIVCNSPRVETDVTPSTFVCTLTPHIASKTYLINNSTYGPFEDIVTMSCNQLDYDSYTATTPIETKIYIEHYAKNKGIIYQKFSFKSQSNTYTSEFIMQSQD